MSQGVPGAPLGCLLVVAVVVALVAVVLVAVVLVVVVLVVVVLVAVVLVAVVLVMVRLFQVLVFVVQVQARLLLLPPPQMLLLPPPLLTRLALLWLALWLWLLPPGVHCMGRVWRWVAAGPWVERACELLLLLLLTAAVVVVAPAVFLAVVRMPLAALQQGLQGLQALQRPPPTPPPPPLPVFHKGPPSGLSPRRQPPPPLLPDQVLRVMARAPQRELAQVTWALLRPAP